MKSQMRRIRTLLAVLVIGLPCASLAQDHDDWIDIQSASWSSHQLGQTTRLADGRYKTSQGQYLIVEDGKVAAKGNDYRRHRPQAAPGRGSGVRPAQGDITSAQGQEEAGLLLPAVQRVAPQEPGSTSSAAGRDVQTAPQRGIEPDEIDARATARGGPRDGAPRDVQTAPQRGIEPDEIDARATARNRAAQTRGLEGRAPAQSARTGRGTGLTLQQMMTRLQPRQSALIAVQPGGGPGGPTNVQTRPAEPPRYEIAECGTAAKPMICCHHEQGDGSSCNLFKILCENAGGTAQGDGESAACSDW